MAQHEDRRTLTGKRPKGKPSPQHAKVFVLCRDAKKRLVPCSG